jgi:hypothetical protein
VSKNIFCRSSNLYYCNHHSIRQRNIENSFATNDNRNSIIVCGGSADDHYLAASSGIKMIFPECEETIWIMEGADRHMKRRKRRGRREKQTNFFRQKGLRIWGGGNEDDGQFSPGCVKNLRLFNSRLSTPKAQKQFNNVSLFWNILIHNF